MVEKHYIMVAGIGYIAIGLLILSGIITFFYIKKEDSLLSIMSLDEEE